MRSALFLRPEVSALCVSKTVANLCYVPGEKIIKIFVMNKCLMKLTAIFHYLEAKIYHLF